LSGQFIRCAFRNQAYIRLIKVSRAGTIGLSLAVIGVFIALYRALFVKPVVAKLGERGAITIGLLGGALGYAIFGLSQRGILFWLGIPLLNMMSFAWVAAQSVLSHKVGPTEQGPLQGAINSLRGIAGLIGPGLFTGIFSKSIGPDAVIHLPGLAFYLAALLLLVSLALMQLSAAPERHQNSRLSQ
jgi:DHA1 family tetracycline resistance protein-like MFS transporter